MSDLELKEVIDTLVDTYLAKIVKPRNETELQVYNAKVAKLKDVAESKIDRIITRHTEAEVAEVATREFDGEWGITSLRQLSESLEVADNAGDIRECSDALKAILYQLQSPSKEKEQE